jgi:putative ABC transport system permease protein
MPMIPYVIKYILRILCREKWYAVVSIVGFSLALACNFMIFHFIFNELGFDQFHDNKKRIYRVISDPMFETQKQKSPFFIPQFADGLKEHYPEIESTVRFHVPREMYIQVNGETYKENSVVYTDTSFFTVFSFKLIKGNSSTALRLPNSAILSRKIAKNYFGTEDAIGKELVLNNALSFLVTGILEDVPKNSHIMFDIILPYSALPKNENIYMQQGVVYLLLKDNVSVKTLEEKMLRDKKEIVWWLLGGSNLYLQPLSKIHLDTRVADGSPFVPNRSKSTLRIAAFIGLLFFVIACLNYFNLSIARSVKNVKRVSMHRIQGAKGKQIFIQYVIEALLLSGIASIMALVLFDMALPYFNNIVSSNNPFDVFKHWYYGAIVGIIWLCTGILSASYPAFVFIFQKSPLPSGKHPSLRKCFIIFQFIASIIFISFTIVIRNQLDFIQNNNRGYNTDHLLTIDLKKENAQSIKNECKNYPGILSASVIYGSLSWGGTYSTEQSIAEKTQQITEFYVDDDFWKTTQPTFIWGCHRENSTRIILNETAMKAYGITKPEAESIDDLHGEKKMISGIIRDMYSITSFYEPIKPTLYFPLSEKPANRIILRIAPEKVHSTMDYLKNSWRKFEPFKPFEYKFVDDEFDQYYRNEKRLVSGMMISAILLISMACLGSLGLIALAAEQRTKEIGIRKAVGASVFNIILLLIKDFTKCVLIANFIAWPIAWYAIDKWLQNFTNRIDLTVWPFVLSGLTALMIALLTVSWRAIRAARANPVESLRYE